MSNFFAQMQQDVNDFMQAVEYMKESNRISKDESLTFEERHLRLKEIHAKWKELLDKNEKYLV